MSWTAGSPPGAQPAPYAYPLNTAYTPVHVRQGFSQPYSTNPSQTTTATMTPQPAQTQSKKVDWPDSVRRYVQRSFEEFNLDPTVTRNEMEAKLKETISYTQNCNIMYTTDWDKMPLPQQMILQQREEARKASREAAAATAAPPVSASPIGKKRKSSDLGGGDLTNTSSTPWRSNKGGSLENRITRAPMDGPLPSKSKFQKNAEKRQRRGDGGYQSSYRSPSPPPTSGPIKGTNTNLEKPYFRLTAPPKAADVRPEHVLRQTLELLKRKWRKEQNYNYICEQFKSARQDLTVQRIRNEFTVSVYEIHARIALEKGDLGEYNQCQTQLRVLYASGIKGNSTEFKAYRVLYFIHTANRSALNDAIADLTTAEKEEPPIKHALNVRSALALGNHHKFFQLYLDVPMMGAYLMDMFVKRERLAYLSSMCKAFKPDVKLRYITEELAFESDAEACQFIIDHGAQDLLVDKEGLIVFLVGKAGSYFEAARAEAFSRVDLKGQI